MFVYRIAKKEFISDLSGEGARIFGGRWNRKGTNLLYTSESRALATVEYLVHIPMSLIPRKISIARIALPEEIFIDKISFEELPSDWMTYPAPSILSEIIEKKIKQENICAVKVPSAIVRGEWNILINPRHDEFKKVILEKVEDYIFDERLLRR